MISEWNQYISNLNSIRLRQRWDTVEARWSGIKLICCFYLTIWNWRNQSIESVCFRVSIEEYWTDRIQGNGKLNHLRAHEAKQNKFFAITFLQQYPLVHCGLTSFSLSHLPVTTAWLFSTNLNFPKSYKWYPLIIIYSLRKGFCVSVVCSRFTISASLLDRRKIVQQCAEIWMRKPTTV